MFAPRSRLAVSTALLFLAVASLPPSTPAEPASAAIYTPTMQAQHGLSGNYYTHDNRSDKTLSGVAFDDFGLPIPQKEPDATRVDPQIAFGKDKGFLRVDGQQFVWWTPQDAAAVVWKGYIHLPKAGTYYLTTVSKGASAIYLNEARVALNGFDAGNLPSDAFAYDPEELKYDLPPYTSLEPSGNPDGRSYVVPITIDNPRDFPIEVRCTLQGGQRLLGIDMLWVTPDSRRDASGKPVAEIVPNDALYTVAPGPTDKSVVRGANSTISADHLYPPADGLTFTTLTIRLADESGQPVAGKRVHVSPLTSSDHLSSFTFIPPGKPTDEHGNAIFKVKTLVADDLSFYATDVDDMVDVTQVAHVTTVKSSEDDFFPDTFAPYYDGNYFLVEPLPLVQGSPATIKFPLENHGKNPVDLTATFSTRESNIGAPDWQEVGKVEHIVLQPGETREVATTWTPQDASEHLCFKIEISGQYLSAGTRRSVQFASFMPDPRALSMTLLAPNAQAIPSATRTRNIGPVIKCSLPELITGRCGKEPPPPQEPPRIGKGGPEPGGGSQLKDGGGNYGRLSSSMFSPECARLWALFQDAAQRGDKEESAKYMELYTKCMERQQKANKLGKDPPDPGYRQPAIAPTDSPEGYMEAARVSIERYQAAQSNTDEEWMARHFTAARLYFGRLSGTLRRDADVLAKEATRTPDDDPGASSRIQKTFEDAVRRLRANGPNDDDLKILEDAGLSEAEARDQLAQLEGESPQLVIEGPKATLTGYAATERRLADESDTLAALRVEGNLAGVTLGQVFTVGNPHDREETVNLFIRPVSIPPNWQLSVVGVEEAPSDSAETATPAHSSPSIKEEEPGKRYSLRLPAKGAMRVASVLVPAGEVGANTVVRWAVEGRIGDELIGGMMHEMDVPYVIPDLQLPAVGSAPAVATPHSAEAEWLLYAGIVALVAIILVTGGLLLWRRRRSR